MAMNVLFCASCSCVDGLIVVLDPDMRSFYSLPLPHPIRPDMGDWFEGKMEGNGTYSCVLHLV